MKSGEPKMKVVIVRGLPGSGKSTLAKKLASEMKAAHWEADMYFMDGGDYNFNPARLGDAHAWCKANALRCLMEGTSVVVSNTFTQKWEAQPYFDMAEEFGAEVVVVECTGNFGSIHDVPASSIEKMKARWEKF